ncbi:hypothetical protein COU75_03590 [Candidatus Peregrinibacteria bacterium CG10_big_fil_rev_8_21_14_0_10_42_8]|nr:MAG: hypothetical protein COU75_03590 [Candidatus Peregrinibacteria bacterium CG10_big_fil_rev_8_21_14_0_10_42_8]
MYHLLAQAWYFFQGAYAGDATYYFTVGQGILNHLQLYTDIFDTKPPAIYLLSAASLALFGSGLLGNICNGMIVLLIPMLFGLTVHRNARNTSTTILATLFGVVISLYTAFTAGAWQVELYGAFFGILYVLLLTQFPPRRTLTYVSLLTLCLFLSISFKEPFFLVLLGCALLLLPRRKEFVSFFVFPIGIVAIVGVILMFVFGFAEGYFGTYLPSNFGHHIARSMPLWQRGLQLDLVWLYLVQYSYLLPVLLLTILFDVVVHNRDRLFYICIALYIACTAANLRGYPVNNHFVILVPLYCALFFVFLRSCSRRLLHTTLFLVTLTIFMIPLSDGFPVYSARLREQQRIDELNIYTAGAIDDILDACSIDRYFFVEERPYMPFMRHSPLNFFVYTGPEAIVYHHPLLIEKQLNSFSSADVIIAKGNTYEISDRAEEQLLSQKTFAYIANHFTITSRPCSSSLPQPEGYSVLFRKEGDTAAFPFTVKY